MLRDAGKEVKEYGFDSENAYAILIYELWMLLRNQAVFSFGVPKALNFDIILKIFKIYNIPEYLHVWCLETLHYISTMIFSAIEENSTKEIKDAGQNRNSHRR